jgi:hypothetical protein
MCIRPISGSTEMMWSQNMPSVTAVAAYIAPSSRPMPSSHPDRRACRSGGLRQAHPPLHRPGGDVHLRRRSGRRASRSDAVRHARRGSFPSCRRLHVRDDAEAGRPSGSGGFGHRSLVHEAISRTNVSTHRRLRVWTCSSGGSRWFAATRRSLGVSGPLFDGLYEYRARCDPSRTGAIVSKRRNA